ncbi:MAG: sodium:solute symporter family protein [Acidobacteriaceae bacterium]|nr:sodium:solute symporter family protein [Acidobacteriaceae bacterium]
MADWLVLAVYLAGITVLGLFVSRKVNTSAGFFLGNRSFGKMVVLAQALGTGTHSDQAVGVAGAAYTAGLSGIWYQWIWLFTTPFYWLLAPIFRRLRVTTIAEFFQLRFGRAYSLAYAVFCIYLFALWQGIAIKGTAVTVSAITGLPEWTVALTVAIIFTVYSIAGGLVAVAATNFVQGLFIIVLSFLVLPFGFHRVGGFAGLHHALPANFFSVFSPPGGELTPFVVSMLVLSGLAGIVVQPHMMSVASTGKTEMDCRVGWTYGNFVKRACTVGWTLTGLLAVILFPGIAFHEREKVFGIAVAALLPSGLIGLMVASLLATVMATCSSFMVNGAALFTEDLYKPLVGGHKSDAHYLMVGRLSSLVITVAGFILGCTMSSVISATVQFISILPFIGVAFWIGIMWPRANRFGAWACTIGSAVVFFATKAHGSTNAWSSLYSLLTGVLLLVVVSLVTPPEPAEKMVRIFGYIDVPVGEEELLPQTGELA